jgi:hypothetical protein
MTDPYNISFSILNNPTGKKGKDIPVTGHGGS